MYMYKQNSALNNDQGLICHKTQPNKICWRWFNLKNPEAFSLNEMFEYWKFLNIFGC